MTGLIDFTTAFTGGPRFFVGFATFARTATGGGQGIQSATGLHIAPRTATGSGLGAESATGLHIAPRTATGSGVGGATVIGLHIAPRTATGSGIGTQTAVGLRINPREATGFGGATTGDEAIGLHIAPRTATGQGTSNESVFGVRVVLRSATGSGVAAESALWVKLFIFYTPATTEIRAADRDDTSIAGLLFRYAEPTYAGVNVYKLTDGTFTQVEQRDYDLISKVYWGGSKNFVSAEEKQELVAAGYGSYVT